MLLYWVSFFQGPPTHRTISFSLFSLKAHSLSPTNSGIKLSKNKFLFYFTVSLCLCLLFFHFLIYVKAMRSPCGCCEQPEVFFHAYFIVSERSAGFMPIRRVYLVYPKRGGGKDLYSRCPGLHKNFNFLSYTMPFTLFVPNVHVCIGASQAQETRQTMIAVVLAIRYGGSSL